jgi:hypothetical protein
MPFPKSLVDTEYVILEGSEVLMVYKLSWEFTEVRSEVYSLLIISFTNLSSATELVYIF